tara:strand:+ start:415 stop:1044 length:630 start_codon:yes stop_codon:yes gene_type:complete
MGEGLLQLDLREYGKMWCDTGIYHDSFDAEEESGILSRLHSFLTSTHKPFHRTTLAGHITGSALVVDRSYEKVLLTHHRKLNKWLQLGGHADGESDVSQVAYREAEEESGLSELEFIDTRSAMRWSPGRPLPFDIDIHAIPARRGEPEHYHYDLCYLLVADEDEKVIVSHESHDVKWWALEAAEVLNPERSMLRQYDKLKALKKLMGLV